MGKHCKPQAELASGWKANTLAWVVGALVASFGHFRLSDLTSYVDYQFVPMSVWLGPAVYATYSYLIQSVDAPSYDLRKETKIKYDEMKRNARSFSAGLEFGLILLSFRIANAWYVDPDNSRLEPLLVFMTLVIAVVHYLRVRD